MRADGATIMKGRPVLRPTDTSMSEQSEQEQIRAEYLELSAHRQADPIERAALETRRGALRVRCTHPDLGKGMLPGDFNQPVAPDQCPDCGYVVER
jgi:hypothetical protein